MRGVICMKDRYEDVSIELIELCDDVITTSDCPWETGSACPAERG